MVYILRWDTKTAVCTDCWSA